MSTVFPIFFCFIRRKVFRAIYWQNLSVADATAPLPRGASGEEGKLSDMPIEYTDVTKKYNKTICDDLGLTAPEGYEAIEG